MLRMCSKWLIATLFLSCQLVVAQSSSSTKFVSALNDYVEYSHEMTSFMNGYWGRLHLAYEDFQVLQKKPTERLRYHESYRCDEFTFINSVASASASLGAQAGPISEACKATRRCLDSVYANSQRMVGYIQLEDYKKDKGLYGLAQLERIRQFYVDFKSQKAKLDAALAKAFASQSSNAGTVYDKAFALITWFVQTDAALLDGFAFNLQEKVHTGFPKQALLDNITLSSEKLEQLKALSGQMNYQLKHYANMICDAVASLIAEKSRAVDGYTFSAMDSDEYYNEAYSSLINYYNNDLIASQRGFCHMAPTYIGKAFLVASKHAIRFEIREKVLVADKSIVPYTDIPFVPVVQAKSTALLPEAVFATMKKIVEYQNAVFQEVSNIWQQIENANVNLKSFAYETSFYYYKGYDKNLPYSLENEALQKIKSLPEPNRSSFQNQVIVMMNILQEMELWHEALIDYASNKKYKEDKFAFIEKARDRYMLLFEEMKIRNLRLYNSCRLMVDSYKPANPSSSWYIAGKKLESAHDHHKAHFQSYRLVREGKLTQIPGYDSLVAIGRDLILNEASYMKGLERYGTSHGLCPYTPYEDIAEHLADYASYERPKKMKFRYTKQDTLMELAILGEASFSGSFRYTVDDYNKFCELAQVKLLPAAQEMPCFLLEEPYIPKDYYTTATNNTNTTTSNTTAVSTNNTGNNNSGNTSNTSQNTLVKNEVQQGKVVHDTVRIVDIVRIETVRKDTVYYQTQKVDTVYITGNEAQKFGSMEGYASVNMVLLLDVSGSMNNVEKLPLLKRSIKTLVRLLREEDQLSIVVYSGKARVLLEPCSAKEVDKIDKIIDGLQSEGNTEPEKGMKLAYKLADKSYLRGGNNRIVLATDGEFSASQEMNDLVSDFAKKDIYLSTFYFGTAESSKLKALAKLGKGQYEHVSKQNIDYKLVEQAKAKSK